MLHPVELHLKRSLALVNTQQSLRIGVAFSGGCDSLALLAACCAIRPGQVHAIYVDHGIRQNQERNSEFELAKKNAAALGAPITRASITPGIIAERSRGFGIEGIARIYRMHALRTVHNRHQLAVVLLAHHQDDVLETVLMRLMRGSSSGGLRGIPMQNPPFFRPFLELPKSDLLAYVAYRGLKFWTDSTNASDAPLRNKVRLYLVPVLEEHFKGWQAGIFSTIKKAQMEDRDISAMATKLAAKKIKGGWQLESAQFFALPESARMRKILELIAQQHLSKHKSRPLPSVSFAMAMDVHCAILEGRRFFGNGLEVIRQGECITFKRILDFPSSHGYFVIISRIGEFHVGALTVKLAKIGEENTTSKYSFANFPLILRTRKPGDEMRTACGTKKIEQILGDLKIPLRFRYRVPILEDSQGIIAILASVYGGLDYFRIRDNNHSGIKLQITGRRSQGIHGFRRSTG